MAGSVGFAARLGGRGSTKLMSAGAQAYSSGALSGFALNPATPTANMTVVVGGVAGTPDIAVAANATGNRVFLGNRNTDSFTLAITAPASNSKRVAIVVFTNDLSVATTDPTSTADNPSSCSIIAVSGTSSASPVDPTDAQIRTAITTAGFTGSQAAYAVVGIVQLTSSTTTLTASNFTNYRAGLGTDNITDGAVTSSKVDLTSFNFGAVVDVSSGNVNINGGTSLNIFTNSTGKRVLLMLATTGRTSRLNVRIGSATGKTVGYINGDASATVPLNNGESAYLTNPGTTSNGWLEVGYRTI